MVAFNYDEERLRQQRYDSSLSGLQNDFAGTLSGLAHIYDNRQLGLNSGYDATLNSFQSNFQNSLNSYRNYSTNNLAGFQNRISQAAQPGMVTVNYGYKGQDPNQTYQGWQRQVDQLQGLYSKGLGLLSKYNPDAAGLYNDTFNQLQSGFRGASPSMYGYDSANFDRFHNPKTVNETQAADEWANYANFQSNLENQREGVLSYLTQMSNIAQDVYSRGLAAEGQTKQKRLTERNQWFANEASRQAGMLSAQAERRSAQAVQRRRQQVNTGSNPYGMLSTQNLTR